MKEKLLNEGKLLDDDVKLLRQQIMFKKPYGEVLNFAINQLALSREEAEKLYDQLVVECHESWRGVRND